MKRKTCANEEDENEENPDDDEKEWRERLHKRIRLLKKIPPPGDLTVTLEKDVKKPENKDTESIHPDDEEDDIFFTRQSVAEKKEMEALKSNQEEFLKAFHFFRFHMKGGIGLEDRIWMQYEEGFLENYADKEKHLNLALQDELFVKLWRDGQWNRPGDYGYNPSLKSSKKSSESSKQSSNKGGK